MTSHIRDIAALLTGRYGTHVAEVTAAGTGDATEVNGAYIDRLGFSCVKVLIGFSFTLGGTETISFAGNLQDASDSGGTGVADFGDAAASTVAATGDSGGSTETGVFEMDFDLTGADRWVRAQFTPDLSAANTDTGFCFALYVLGGEDQPPSTARAN